MWGIGTRPVICTLLAVGLATLAAACGSSGASGIAAKSPAQILTAATSALEHASTVHLSGQETTGGQTTTLDLRIASGKGATGTISTGGLSFQLIVIGNVVYLYGSPAFLQHFGGATAAKAFAGRWIKAPAASGSFSGLAELTNLQQIAQGLVGAHGALTKQSNQTIAGQSALALVDSSKDAKLFIASSGTPYPLEITKDGGAQHVSFTQYNASVPLTPPASSIDITKLRTS